METLHSIRDYSPFSARSNSPTTSDETGFYAAEVNYTYRQHRLANDTDAFEHRNQPMPYSLLPTEAEVVFARLFHSVGAAQILCYFLFPAITAWLLIGVFLQLDASLPLAALLALLTLVASFSLRTLDNGARDLLAHGLHSGFIETLPASRNPNPNMTFPLFLGALLALIAALRRRSNGFALLAGVLGGLLFYSYVFYAIACSAAVAVLVLVALLRGRTSTRPASAGPTLVGPSLVALLVTICMAVPFLLWVRAAKRAGGYFYRMNRMGMVYSHLPSPQELKLSAVYGSVLLLLWILWRYVLPKSRSAGDRGRSFAGSAVLVFGCAVAGGILGMNMQLVSGFNLQAESHFPHMILQPAMVLLCLVISLAATVKIREKRSALWAAALFLIFFAVCASVQVEAAVNSAPLHRVDPSQQALFHWLNRNTQRGDVVATTSLELTFDMPVFSQDYTLMVEGSRTSASNSEILERYLLAEALTGTPAATVTDELGSGKLIYPSRQSSTYPAFFFEHSPDLAGPGTVNPSVLEKSLAEYRTLDPALELKRFRVNYLYTENGQTPTKIAGVSWQKVLETPEGSLWRLNRVQPAH
ncbi:MAG: hypothetical protein WAM66_01550 [Acidobacteriaceae bacterium]